jgi:hypothetical protein
MPREGGASSTPRPIVLIIGISGILDHPHARVMTTEGMARSYSSRHISTFPRPNTRDLPNRFPQQKEGAGKTGCTLHPRSRVQTAQKNAHEHTGSAETLRPSPRNGFTTYSVLSLVTGFLATIVSRALPQNLAPASGRQNHTTSPSASRAVRQSASASTASHRAFRDDREPPLLSGETGELIALICPTL